MASEHKIVGLGLQGGGSHTAFTWGVLDRLLDEVEEGNLSIAAISGTSGGALTGARVHLRLDGWAEGSKATAEGAVGCGLQQIAMASRALSDASAQRLPRAMERRLVVDGDRSWHGRADLLALLEPVVGERHRPGNRRGHPGPRSIERDQSQGTETFCVRHKCEQDGAPNLQSRGDQARGDHAKDADGVDLLTNSLSRRRDRRGILLGRRLHGQSRAEPTRRLRRLALNCRAKTASEPI